MREKCTRDTRFKIFVTYTYRICSEINNGDAQRNVQQNNTNITIDEKESELWNCQLSVKKTDHSGLRHPPVSPLAGSHRPGSPRKTPLPSPLPTLSPPPPPTLWARWGNRTRLSKVVIPGPSPGHLTRSALELHHTVTLPIKLNIAVIYRPPGLLGDFDEIDALLSTVKMAPHFWVTSTSTQRSYT